MGLRAALLGVVALLLASCGINDIPRLEESAKAAWAQVENQYQRRADLVPNLVEVVKGYAAHEREVLTQVTEARAKATQVTLPANALADPEALRAFESSQAALGQALARLLAVVERYPDLKANQSFLALQSQLEGTENRVAVARRDFIEAVRAYNTELKTIPGRWYRAILYPEAMPLATFEAPADVSAPPKVSF